MITSVCVIDRPDLIMARKDSTQTSKAKKEDGDETPGGKNTKKKTTRTRQEQKYKGSNFI